MTVVTDGPYSLDARLLAFERHQRQLEAGEDPSARERGQIEGPSPDSDRDMIFDRDRSQKGQQDQ